MEKNKVKFLSINSDFPVLAYDIKNEPVKEKILLEPFAKGKDGKILNDSKYFRVVESGSSFDFQAKIESYRDDVEIYSILKRVLSSGDNSLLMRNSGSYMDVYDLDCKSNLDLFNTCNATVNKINNALSNMNQKEAASSPNPIRSEEAASNESEVVINE